MTNLLFVYGTLLQRGNPFANYLMQHCTYIAAGKIKGTLYDIGEYPGMIITVNNYVCGSVYQLHHSEENLRVIDDYEGYGPGQHQPNLYIRLLASIETDNGIVNAWVYQYNLPVDGLPQITSGNYADYTKQKKIPR
jgi:gamma-glutamylcyclotransferase (GGCT)/AIG2-like uncharacterized protein YtfP